MSIVISGTGVYLPPNIITNTELVNSYNAYANRYNKQHAQEISQGFVVPLLFSSESFIVKASMIESRHVIDKEGILDIDKMHPDFECYNAAGVSIQAQVGIYAAQKALAAAHKTPEDIGMVIASCSGFQRFYPAIAIEIQNSLGIEGLAYDMNVACSSITFALFNAYNAIKSKQVKAVLVVTPELFTAQTDFTDRNQHFLFGDASTAFIVENIEGCTYSSPYEIQDIRLKTRYSKNIYNEFGITGIFDDKKYFFNQQGSKVFKDVINFTSKLIDEQLHERHIEIPKVFWLHQANGNMNELIVKKILNREPSMEEMPLPLRYCGNTSSSGVMIAYDSTHKDLKRGNIGLMVTFGGGYSFGSVVLMKL